MALQVVTYSSDTQMPPTILVANTLFQNTQMRLSYTHVHFLAAGGPIPDCDMLAIDATHAPAELLLQTQLAFHGTVIWSKDVLATTSSFLQNFSQADGKHYVVIANGNDMDIQQREDSKEAPGASSLQVKEEPKKKSFADEYLEHKFNGLRRAGSIEGIFARLHLMSERRNVD